MQKPQRTKPSYLLLDTHVWIWLLNGNADKLGKEQIKLIERFAKDEAVRVSAISVWEIGMFVAKKRIQLSKDVNLWVKDSFKGHGLFCEPLSIDILLGSTQLADDFHGDPADRLIIATAKLINATIMTADQKIIHYCKKHHLSVEPL